MVREISESRRKINEFLGRLKDYIGEQQDEVREYSLNEEECSVIRNYLRSMADQEGLAMRLGGAYLIHRGVYGDPVLAYLDEDEQILSTVGDSLALGEMQSDLEDKLEETFDRKKNLGLKRQMKAVVGRENMGFPADL